MLSLFTSVASAAVYRIEKPDGSVAYTDVKPAEISENVTEIPLPEVQNSTDTRAITRGYDSILKVEERARDKNLAKAKRRQKLLAPKLKALKKAQQNLLDGQQKREGDYIRNTNGGTRLSPSYVARIKKLEQAVDTAEQAYEKAKLAN